MFYWQSGEIPSLKRVLTPFEPAYLIPTIKKTLIAAHRGDWRNACENSLEAIENAIRMGVDIVEVDLQRTKDGELILMHDRKLDRTTTGYGWWRIGLSTVFAH